MASEMIAIGNLATPASLLCYWHYNRSPVHNTCSPVHNTCSPVHKTFDLLDGLPTNLQLELQSYRLLLLELQQIQQRTAVCRCLLLYGRLIADAIISRHSSTLLAYHPIRLDPIKRAVS
jgi:hypothetical protein